MPRLFIYNTEANDKLPAQREALQEQFGVMMKRLWYGITWPSAILTLILGTIVLFEGGWQRLVFRPEGSWLLLKLILVLFLYAYHVSLQIILGQQLRNSFRFSSQQLRIWNEVATIFLVAIVMLVVVRQNLSVVWGILGLFLFILLLMSAIRIYKMLRK